MRARQNILLYAILSLCGFFGGLIILFLMIWKVDKLVALGLVGNLYYMLLPLGLSVAVLLFGTMRSYAFYSGQQWGGTIELGGPVVVFFIVLLLGFRLPGPASNISMTVYVHGVQGPQDLPLRSKGKIMLDTSGLRREASIGSNGEAFFPEISASFRGQDVPVLLDAAGYELVDPHLKITLAGGSAYVEVRRKPGRIAGYVHDDQANPIVQATASIGKLTTSTDASGYFVLSIPSEELHDQLSLVVAAPGFEPWHSTVVPDSNDAVISLRRQK